MKRYMIPYKKTAWGCFYVKAKNDKDAIRKCNEGEIMDENDNKSDYEIDYKSMEWEEWD